MNIKLRVWDKKTNQMCKVGAVYFSDSFELDAISVHLPNGLVVIRSINDCIVMQSTGLKDKNGEEIYERDVVVSESGKVGYVAYLPQEAGFVVVTNKGDYRLGHRNTGEGYDVANTHEIVDNIYECADGSVVQ